MSEARLIEQYFTRPASHSQTFLGVGDDAAAVSVKEGFLQLSSTDTLVENVHFFSGVAPDFLAHKAAAVSLSDIAAMGGAPHGLLLALTLPSLSESWLSSFSEGLFALLRSTRVDLLGGDITRGPLSLTTVGLGMVPQSQILLRSGAQVGDDIYVTGCLGEAGVVLKAMQARVQAAQSFKDIEQHYPMPRIQAGIALRGLASAAIDISDGLVLDLERLCLSSQVGASIELDKVPVCRADPKFALASGEDYELCFTVPPSKVSQLKGLCLEVDITQIGRITAEKQETRVQVIQKNGAKLRLSEKGYQHF